MAGKPHTKLPQRLNHLGKVFGKWTVLSEGKRGKLGQRYWVCRCDCGAVKEVLGTQLLHGRATMCNPCALELNRPKPKYHGALGRRSPLYTAWKSMKARCADRKWKYRHRYFGRGIRVCDEWANDFVAFAIHIGPPPETGSKMTVDRKDNDGNYEPGNVRWATYKEQRANQSRVTTDLK